MSSAIGKQTRLNSGFLHLLSISDHTMTIQIYFCLKRSG